MTKTISPLEKELAEKPIHIPGNPFWDVFKRFGKDEAISAFVNICGTVAVDKMIGNIEDLQNNQEAKKWILSLTGPIVEKIGFFPAHFWEAYKVYKTTSKDERKEFSHYFKTAMKGGAVSLGEDIAVHDPLYIGLMYLGLQSYPGTPTWLLAGGSFVAAVFGVAALEVGFTESRYKLFQHKLKKRGFGTEKYFESRFFIDQRKNPEEILKAMEQKFELDKHHKGEYSDNYFKTTLPKYSGRTPKLRLRKRHVDTKDGNFQSAQITYVRTSELAKSEAGQFRYFPQKKEKFYFPLDQSMPETVHDIEDPRVRKYLEAIVSKEGNSSNVPESTINFERTLAYNDRLLVSADRVNFGDLPVYVVELKTRNDKNLLQQAMRYVMMEFPVMQITHGKADLAQISQAL